MRGVEKIYYLLQNLIGMVEEPPLAVNSCPRLRHGIFKRVQVYEGEFAS